MAVAERKLRQRRFIHNFIQALSKDDYISACKLLDDVTQLTSGHNDDSIDVDSPSPIAGGRSPLQVVIERASHVTDGGENLIGGLANVCQRLIAAGVDVNRRYSSGIDTGGTALHHAVRVDRDEGLLVGALLDSSDADVEATDLAGRTPLALAADLDASTQIVQRLVAAGCFVNRINDAGDTPLITCARRGHSDQVGILSQQCKDDVDLNATDQERRTALIVAATEGHERIVQLLIEAGCNLNAADRYGRTALYFAAKNGHYDILQRLMSAGADINKPDTKGLTPLAIAMENLHMAIIKQLIDAGCDVNLADHDNKQRTIHNAVRYSGRVYGQREFHLQVVKMLLARPNCDVNVSDKQGQTPLYLAAVNGETDIVRLLIEKGVDVTKRTNSLDTALHGSIHGNQPDIADMLIKAGCDVNAVNNLNKLALYMAVESRAENELPSKLESLVASRCSSGESSCRIVRLLLDSSSKTDVCESKNNQSPLYVAVKQQYVEAVKMIIDAGCDVNLSDSAGCTPLQIACGLGNDVIVDTLLRHRDIDVDRGSVHQYPIHAAASAGSQSIVEKLIDAGCDINKLSLTGVSALFQAADKNHIDVARLLIRRGASPSAVGSQLPPGSLCCRAHRDAHPHLELHPLFVAVENNNLVMIKLLLVASPRMPYWQMATLRDILFRTGYAREARLGKQTFVQYAYLFTGVLSRPRPLADECRGAIREAIVFGRFRKKLTLERAVDLLPLPDRLRDFLLLRNESVVKDGSSEV